MERRTVEKIVIGSLFGSLLLLLGVAAYHVNKNIGLLKDAVIKLAGIKFKLAKPDLAVVNFTFSFQNKSDIDIVVTGYNFDFKVNNIFIGKVVSNTSQYIAAYTTSPLEVVGAFDPKKVWGDFLNPEFLKSLADYKNIGVSLKGYVSAKHKALSIQNIAVEYTVKVGDYLDKEVPKA